MALSLATHAAHPHLCSPAPLARNAGPGLPLRGGLRRRTRFFGVNLVVSSRLGRRRYELPSAVPRLVEIVARSDGIRVGELRGRGPAEDAGAAVAAEVGVSGREQGSASGMGEDLWRGLGERVWGGGRLVWDSVAANLVTASSAAAVWVTSAAIVVVLLTSAPLDATAAVMAPRKLRGDELATVQLFQDNTPSVVYITNLAVRYVPNSPVSNAFNFAMTYRFTSCQSPSSY